MRWLAVVNPTAHNGAGLGHLHSLERVLHQDLGAECAWSTYPGHALDIARSSQGFDGLIAVGGDGTIFEVLNGMNVQAQCLAIVPSGTGNGLARELHLRTVSSAVHQLRRPRLAALDLIRVRFRAGPNWHERYVVHTSALGYFSELNALGLGLLKPLGSLRYAAAACVQSFRRNRFHARMRIDDGDERELVLTNLAVNNTRHAGSFCLCPQASLQDGRIDLFYGANLPRQHLLEDLGILTQMYFGGRSVRCQAQAVSVDLVRPMALMLDGEQIPPVDAVRFQVVRGCLRCVTGPESGLKLLDEEPTLADPFAGPATCRRPARC
jgi:diacylglycerol kinase (ATP)